MSGARVPDFYYALREHASGLLGYVDPKHRVCDFNVEYANIRSDMKVGLIPKAEIIERLERVEAKYESLTQTMPCTWWYETVQNAEDEYQLRVFKQRYDVYPNRHITQTNNVIRWTRILLNETLFEHYDVPEPTPGDREAMVGYKIDAGIRATLSAKIRSMADDICYSAPQYIDCSISAPAASASEPFTPSGDCRAHTLDTFLNCYSLIYPMYVAARSPHVGPTLRTWVKDRFRHMGSHFGIQRAGEVAQILDRPEDVTPWTVYGMLGSYSFAA